MRYEFAIITGGVTREVFPLYKDSLALNIDRDANEMYFRTKLSEKIVFAGDDYEYIAAQGIDTRFVLVIIAYFDNFTPVEYWRGRFWKTDCEFDVDAHTATATIESMDNYTDILAGIEKEYDIIKLAPPIVRARLDKRPMVQVYLAGASAIGCFLSGMWWEMECDPVSETDTVEVGGVTVNKLEHLGFGRLDNCAEIGLIGQDISPDDIPDAFLVDVQNDTLEFPFTSTRGEWTLTGTTEYVQYVGQINRIDLSRSGIILFSGAAGNEIPTRLLAASDASGYIDVSVTYHPVYARMVTDLEEIEYGGQTLQTWPVQSDDLVAANLNYRYVIPYEVSGSIAFSLDLSSTPTEWGRYDDGRYYMRPATIGTMIFPVSRLFWGRVSVWFLSSPLDGTFEAAGRLPFELKDAYRVSDVIAALLKEIAPDISFEATADYSAFLFGSVNPLTEEAMQVLLMAPKSNLIHTNYDQPAQKAPVTLRTVLNMLRDCYRCFWFVDSQRRFRIEHVSWFMNGGSYLSKLVGADLTLAMNARTGKPWSYGQNKYKFDKPEMTQRYQFGWMDDCTELFNGRPIEIVSNFVQAGLVEDVNIANFTSDVDYIMLMPGEISKDGFVLVAAETSQDEDVYFVPYKTFSLDGGHQNLQNGYASFQYLQMYYRYDLPAKKYKIAGVQLDALGVKMLKTHSLRFPLLQDIDLIKLIRTNLGLGFLTKLSLNLSSRSANVTVRYGTE